MLGFSYGLGIQKGYQKTSGIESDVVTKVKGVVNAKFTDAELGVPNPEFYRRIWDASDVVLHTHGDDSGGFVIITNLVITPNQTRGVCPEVYSANR
jgi:P2X purinoceptor 4